MVKYEELRDLNWINFLLFCGREKVWKMRGNFFGFFLIQKLWIKKFLAFYPELHEIYLTWWF